MKNEKGAYYFNNLKFSKNSLTLRYTLLLDRMYQLFGFIKKKICKLDYIVIKDIIIPLDTDELNLNNYPSTSLAETLKSLPTEIGRLTCLERLELNNNRLISLPQEIGKLYALKGLYLRNNQLISIPAEMGNLTALIELDLGNNQLTSLPAEIGNLSALKIVFLFGNQLTSIPPEIEKLTSLEFLHLENNELGSLPREIGKLNTLKELWLCNNELPSLPVEIGNLDALEVLYLSINRLTSLPVELLGLKNLNEFEVSCDKLLRSSTLQFTKFPVVHIRKQLLQQISWNEHYHQFYPERARENIFTIIMIGSMTSGIPNHPEASFYKLPKEILYTIFRFYTDSVVDEMISK